MHISLGKHIKVMFLAALLLGAVTPFYASQNQVDAQAACCGGGIIDPTFSCIQASSCSSNQCAYVSECFVCTLDRIGDGGCQFASIGANVFLYGGCRPKTVCPDGTLTCGGCGGGGTGVPVDPPPGCNNPGNVSFGSNPLTAPANNSLGLNPVRVVFQWNRVGSGSTANGVDWGHVDNSCVAQTRTYSIFVKKVTAATACAGQDRSTFTSIDGLSYPSGGNDPMNLSVTYNDTNLDYGSTYCWFVRKSNTGGSPANSSIWKFSTDARPILTGTRIVNPRNNSIVPTCGADISRIGKFTASSSTIHNPIDIEVTWVDPDSVGDFKNIYLAFIPTETSNGEAARLDDSSVQTKIQNRRTLNARYTIDNTLSVENISTSSLTGSYTPNATSGDITNNIDGNAIVLGIGSATNVTITNNPDNSRTVVANFRLQINDNFPNNNTNPLSAFFSHYNLYSMFIFTRSRVNGMGQTIITEYSGDINQNNVTNTLRYMKSDKILYIDTASPTPVISSIPNGDGSFNVTWRPQDNLGLRTNTTFLTTVHASVAGDSLQENYPSGATINPVPTVLPVVSNLSAYLSLANGVNFTRAYRDQNLGVNSNFTFTLDIEDLSCNRGDFQLTVTGLPSPWVSVFNSNASIGNVLSGSTIPQIAGYNQLFQLEDATDIRQPFTTAYAFILGSNSLPSAYISYRDQYVSTYDDLGLDPPESASWYSYFLDKVQNSTTPVTSIGSLTTSTPGALASTAPLSTALGAAVGEKRNYIVNGNLVLNRRTNCNLRSIFVISGNLTIHSDFQITENASATIFNGCIFVVQGTVSMINYAPTASRTKYPTTAEHATYGLFEASIFADGNINISRSGATPLGTFLVGNLTSRGNISDSATFQNTDNLTKPSFLVYSDPRYLITFLNDLGRFAYSIREEGVVP